MKLTLALIALSLSLSALADGYDCRKSGSPHGGKFCVYVVPECASEVSCEEAAACAVKQYASNVTWISVKNVKVLQSKSIEEEGVLLQETNVSFKGNNQSLEAVVVTQPNKIRYDGKVVCEPVAVNY